MTSSDPTATDLLPSLLAADAALRRLPDGLFSCLEGDGGAPYDGKAVAYDLLVGCALYNRVVWRTPKTTHGAFAAEALASGVGPYLETGCGSALFTHEAYAGAARPLVLLDRSLDMLRQARKRVGEGPAFLQGDLFALPFAAGAFPTVSCLGVLHVLADLDAALAGLWRCVAPGGSLWLGSIVRPPHPLGRGWYRALVAAGEVVPARTDAEIAARLRDISGQAVELRVQGSFAFLVARRPAS